MLDLLTTGPCLPNLSSSPVPIPPRSSAPPCCVSRHCSSSPRGNTRPNFFREKQSISHPIACQISPCGGALSTGSEISGRGGSPLPHNSALPTGRSHVIVPDGTGGVGAAEQILQPATTKPPSRAATVGILTMALAAGMRPQQEQGGGGALIQVDGPDVLEAEEGTRWTVLAHVPSKEWSLKDAFERPLVDAQPLDIALLEAQPSPRHFENLEERTALEEAQASSPHPEAAATAVRTCPVNPSAADVEGNWVAADLVPEPKVARAALPAKRVKAFTPEKARLLRKMERESEEFHDVWYHSELFARAALEPPKLEAESQPKPKTAPSAGALLAWLQYMRALLFPPLVAITCEGQLSASRQVERTTLDHLNEQLPARGSWWYPMW